jgi:hypothetical protein
MDGGEQLGRRLPFLDREPQNKKKKRVIFQQRPMVV